jgi:hypothetical protein
MDGGMEKLDPCKVAFLPIGANPLTFNILENSTL